MAIDKRLLLDSLNKMLSMKKTHFSEKEKELEANYRKGRITNQEYSSGREDLRIVLSQIDDLKKEIGKVHANLFV